MVLDALGSFYAANGKPAENVVVHVSWFHIARILAVLRTLSDIFLGVKVTFRKDIYSETALVSFAKSDDKTDYLLLIYSAEEISYMLEKHHGEFERKIVEQQMRTYFGDRE